MPPEEAPLTLHARQAGVRPNALARKLTRASVGSFVLSVGLMLALSWAYPGRHSAPRWASVLTFLPLLAAAGLGVAAAIAHLARWILPVLRGRVAVDAEGISLNGKRYERARITSAWTLREAAGARVELLLDNGDVLSVAVGDEERARALLDAAKIDAERRALRIPFGHPLSTLGAFSLSLLPASCIASMVSYWISQIVHMPSASMGFLVIALFTLMVSGAVRFASPPEVSVGHDGLALRSVRRSWFVPYASMTGMHDAGSALLFRLVDGTIRELPVAGMSPAHREVLLARIEGAWRGALSPRPLSERLQALDRNGRSVETWQRELQALAEARAGFRAATLSADELQGALDDPSASAERRVGAAFVLAAMDPAQGGARVRVAAQAIAQEPLRDALGHAAEGAFAEAVRGAERAAREVG